MDERFTSREEGIQPSSARPSLLPDPGPVGPAEENAARTPAPPEQNRELDWFLLWAIWGAISGLLFQPGPDLRRVIIPTITHAILGRVGGAIGEKYVGQRAAKDLIWFWMRFWVAFWTVIYLGPTLIVWAVAYLHGDNVEGVLQALLIGSTMAVAVGSVGGAIGGIVRARRKQSKRPLGADGTSKSQDAGVALMSEQKRVCCSTMEMHLRWKCDQHHDPNDCPDCVVWFYRGNGAYGMPIHDGGSSYIQIDYCPWCGAALRASSPLGLPEK